ncbi:shikimate O-hydroxycinnamoyltransferase [Tanacetum coccineum]
MVVTVVALNMIVLKLGYTGKSEPMSFKLIEVYIEHGVTALDSYLMASRFRATLKEITDELGSIEANRTEKMLLLTWHESSEIPKEPVCDSVTPNSLPQHDSSTICNDSVSESITPRYGETAFADIAGSGVDNSGLSHDESFGVDDLDLNLNEPVNLNVSQVESQSELPVSEEPDVGRTHEPILAEVSTQEPFVAEVSTQEPIVAEVSTEVPIVEEIFDDVTKLQIETGDEVKCAEENRVTFATGTLTDDALSWWNAYAQPFGIKQANRITWTELKRLLTNKYCPRTEVKKMEDEFYNLAVKGNDLKTYVRRF